MPKRGENIYKRKDGRWEGRYIKQRHNGGKPQYGYIYGKTYSEVKEKIVKARAGLTRAGEPSSTPLYYKDIIRDWLSMARIRTIDIYNKVGLTAIYVNFNSNESFKESMVIVGTALGEEELASAEKYNKYFDDNVAMVTKRLAGIPDDQKPSVYYIDSRFTDAYHTVGSGEIQEEWITIAGAKLATAADFEGRNLEITAEKFLTLDPDVIMIGAQNQADVYDMNVSY